MLYAYPDICVGVMWDSPPVKNRRDTHQKPPLVVSTRGLMAAPGTSDVVRRGPLSLLMRPRYPPPPPLPN